MSALDAKTDAQPRLHDVRDHQSEAGPPDKDKIEPQEAAAVGGEDHEEAEEEEEEDAEDPGETTPLLPPPDFPTSAKDTARCIIHIDLDAFYAQVETVRLNIPRDIPLGVQQWQGLIAVNYPARAAGITRHLPAPEARKLCPTLRTVHVATYGPEDLQPSYYEAPDLQTHKVSLEPYRRASARIFRIFADELAKLGPGGILEKASIDEAFLDVTQIVQRQVETALQDDPHAADTVTWTDLGILHGASTTAPSASIDASTSQSPIVTHGAHDLRLKHAAVIAKHLRSTVFATLGYTCSAGIAHNKMLAKLCSALNKPNRQTVMRHEATLPFLRDLPFGKIRMLGGKFGDKVEEMVKCEKAGDVWRFEKLELNAMLGDAAGTWLYRLVRGQDDSEVTGRTVTKSMMAAKSFRPALKSLAELQIWFQILSTELYNRVTDDWELHKRWPRNFKMSFTLPNAPSRSRQTAFPPRSSVHSRDPIMSLAKSMFQSELSHTSRQLFPLINLALGVERFEDMHSEGSEATADGMTQMQKWLKKAKPAASTSASTSAHQSTPSATMITSTTAAAAAAEPPKMKPASPTKPFFAKRTLATKPPPSPIKTPVTFVIDDDDENDDGGAKEEPSDDVDQSDQKRNTTDDQKQRVEEEEDYYFICDRPGCRFRLTLPSRSMAASEDIDAMLRLLDRQRTEHIDWHTAVKLSREALDGGGGGVPNSNLKKKSSIDLSSQPQKKRKASMQETQSIKSFFSR